MKKAPIPLLLWLSLIAVAVAIGIWHGVKLNAQSTIPPYQFGVGSFTHTSCVVVPSTTQYCYASDGPFVSILGGAYVSMLPGGTNLTGTAPINVTDGVVSCPTCLQTTGLKAAIDSIGLMATVPSTSAPVQ